MLGLMWALSTRCICLNAASHLMVHNILLYSMLFSSCSHNCSSNSMELSTMSVTVIYAYARRPKSPITHSANMYPCSL